MHYINGIVFTVGLLLAIGSIHARVQENHLKIHSERIGSDLKLSCLAEGQEDSTVLTVEWVDPNGNNVGQGPNLRLRNIKPKEFGNYTCRSYLLKDSKLVQWETRSLIIAESFEHTENSHEFKTENTLNLYEAQSLDMLCDTTDSSKTEKLSHWIKPDGSVISETNRLHIESLVKSRDQGKYVCRTQHSDGTIASKTINLNIKVASLTIEVMPSESIQLNGMIHRRCAGSKDMTLDEKFNYKWADSNNVIVSESDILQVPIKDLSVLGDYRCICTSETSYTTYEITTTIKSDAIPKINAEEYKITIISNPTQFRFGEKFSLECQITPNIGNLDYQWFKDNKYLSSKKVLNLERFQKTDTGLYTCKATGSVKDDVSINMEANSQQVVCNLQHYSIELTSGTGPQIMVKSKQSKELHCNIDTFDNNQTGSDVQWTFKNKKMDEESLTELGLSRFDKKWTSIIVIEEAGPNNEGEYNCKVGDKKKSVDVVILPESGLVHVHPQQVEVPKGSDVEFHCRIDGVKDIVNKNIKWTFESSNGTVVSLPNARWKVSNPCTVPHTSFVHSNNTQMEDNGHFVCTTPDGKQSAGQLIIKEPGNPIKVVATPPILNIYKSQKFEFECFTTDKIGNPVDQKPVVRFLNGSDVKSDSRFVISDIGPSRIRVEAPRGLNIPERELSLTCEVNGSKTPIDIKIKTICPPNQKSCKNGECVDSTNFCNGVKDCLDGSDEDLELCYECDPVSKPCGPTNSTNYSSIQHYSIHWACDGETDCKNGFDEKHCPKSEDLCDTRQFTCKDNTKIPYGFVCDGRNDCDDNEDEIGCVKPQIIRSSENKIRATVGSTVTMICESVGYPLPKIVWRYNWGCTRETDRITVKEVSKNCRNVVSILTIRDFQSGDDAIYGCEAISGTSRVFGNDFFVTMY